MPRTKSIFAAIRLSCRGYSVVKSAAGLALALGTLSGCIPDKMVFGPTIELQPTQISSFANDQTKVLEQLSILAGFDRLPARGSDGWKDVVLAGINYSDLQCEKFIASIFRWNRLGEAAKQEITLVGSTTSTIMALLEATQKELAVTAAIFGLASGTLNNITNSVLFKLEPSRIRQAVESLQAQYYSVVLAVPFQTRSSAVSAIARYHAICLPANIEAEINQRIGGSESKVASFEYSQGLAEGAPVIIEGDTSLKPNSENTVKVKGAAELPEELSIGQTDTFGHAIYEVLDPGRRGVYSGYAKVNYCSAKIGISNAQEILEVITEIDDSRRRSIYKCLQEEGHI